MDTNIQIVQDIITLIKDIITCLSAIVVTGVAIYGLFSWRKQLKGKTEYELAKNLLKAIYKVREATREVRKPIIFEDETNFAKRILGIEKVSQGDNKTKAKLYKIIYDTRLQKISRELNDLAIISIEAEILWGKEIIDRLDKFHVCIGKLPFAINTYILQLENPNLKLDVSDAIDIVDILNGFYNDEDKNKYSLEIEMVIDDINKFLKTYLKL